MDLLCLMFGAPNRGVLASGGLAWSDQEIAERVGGLIGTNLEYLAELLAKGVACRNEQGAIFSRRLVRDEQERKASAERMRKHRTVTPVVTAVVTPNVMPLSGTGNATANEGVVFLEKEELKPPNSIDELIEKVVRLYPKNWRERGKLLMLSPLDCDAAGRAIARDGFDIVVGGARDCAKAYAARPPSDRQFLPNFANWCDQEEYKRGIEYWEKSNGQASKQQQLAHNLREALLASRDGSNRDRGNSSGAAVRERSEGQGLPRLADRSFKATNGSG